MILAALASFLISWDAPTADAAAKVALRLAPPDSAGVILEDTGHRFYFSPAERQGDELRISVRLRFGKEWIAGIYERRAGAAEFSASDISIARCFGVPVYLDANGPARKLDPRRPHERSVIRDGWIASVFDGEPLR